MIHRRNEVVMLRCPKCKSDKISQYRSPVGPIWCSSCGFMVENKERENPFVCVIFQKDKINPDCDARSRLPHSVIEFNPSDPKSVDTIISKYGPEVAYEIARILIKAADDDVSAAVRETMP